jgi:hypothetical protein
LLQLSDPLPLRRQSRSRRNLRFTQVVRERSADQAVEQQIVRREVEQIADAYELQIAALALLRSAAGPSLLTFLRHAAANFMRCAAVSAHDADAHQA